jgi:hypothetical protein
MSLNQLLQRRGGASLRRNPGKVDIRPQSTYRIRRGVPADVVGPPRSDASPGTKPDHRDRTSVGLSSHRERRKFVLERIAPADVRGPVRQRAVL